MIIFQTAGCGYTGAIGFKSGLLADAPSQATTFRSDDYIHRLNRTLQAEVRALSAYVSLAHHRSLEPVIAEGSASHHHASRELVRLVIASRGVPEDRSALSIGLTRRLVTLFNRMPSGLAERATVVTLRQLERQLIPNYKHLLKVAPARDLDTLRELLEQTSKQDLALSV
jgi:hypothetical protein